MSKKITVEQAKKAAETANMYAQSIGKENIKEVMEPIARGLNSDNEVQVELARTAARGAVEQLTKLILKQELFTTPDAPYMDFVEVFSDGVVKEGNAKLYDFNNPTSCDTYNEDQFIADSLSVPDVDEFTIKMYQDRNTLSGQGYQFRKPLVYIEKKWIPYFKSGKLIEFIAQLQAQINKSWKMFIFDKVARKITTSTYGKTITGTATDAFSCWSNEILPEIRKMTTLSSDYTFNSANTNLMSTQPSELLIFAHPKTIQTLQSGIKSQLFNAQLLDLKGLVDAENFKDLGRQLSISTTNPNQRVSTTNDYYVNENTVFIISKEAFKHFSQVDTVETQFYARNLAMEVVMHKWGAMDFLPWGQCFKYTNTNLNTLP